MIRFIDTYCSLLPHSSQNLEPSLFENPHLEHFPGCKAAGGNVEFPKVLANLKLSDPKEEHEFLKSIKFSGSESLQKSLKDLCIEYSDIFSFAYAGMRLLYE